MSETSSVAPDGPLLGQPQGMLALRICGTERDGQVVRLKSPKVTIGASEGCVLRLRSPGVGPLHCVILRGPERTVIHRYLPDTRLNGAGFEETSLRAGDRLGIGPLEFEVIDEPAAGATPQQGHSRDDSSAANSAGTATAERRSGSKTGRRALDKGHKALETERQSLEQQLEALNAQRMSLTGTEARLEAEYKSLQTERQTLAAQCEMLVKGQASLETAQQQLEAHRIELAHARDELQKARNEWQAERQQSADREAETALKSQQAPDDRERRLAEREAQVQHDIAQLDRQQEDFAEQRAKWETVNAARESDFAQRIESLERRLADMDEERRQIAGQRDQLQHQRKQFEGELAKLGESPPWPAGQADAGTPGSSPAATAAGVEPSGAEEDDELFARLRALSLLKESAGHESTVRSTAHEAADDVTDTETPSAGPEGLAEEDQMSTDTAPPSGQEEHHDDEESIDNYMARLLQRMRGMATDSATEPTRNTPADTESSVPAMSCESAARGSPARDLPSPASEPARSKSPKLSRFEQRKTAPEKAIDLAAMRELANISARSAIASHHERRRASFAGKKLGLAGAGLVMSVFLLAWSPFGSLFFLGGFVGLIASMVFLAQAGVLAILARLLQEKMSQRTKGNDEAIRPAARTASETQDRGEGADET